jgi:hypothetical protein
MPKDAKAIHSGLMKKGFRPRENDHTFYHLFVNEKKTVIFTKVSHGEKEVGDKLLGMMARQVRLTKRDFLNLVDCPLKMDEYLILLRQAGHIAG